ncbi:hypothetical protein TNIN_5091 [Trichonephila inaurata madagascariensis]|uniref:Uncharacterized protein n=1 Tax=Trichonephila inaurata madagascariensis TaxID=2747483 RepID=A0A8X6WL22_9ARAC|nr:hypothetical protein TNIN_5091 [Trichonephila inaurata madagascariensis]
MQPADRWFSGRMPPLRGWPGRFPADVILFCFGTRFLLSAVERLQCEGKREETCNRRIGGSVVECRLALAGGPGRFPADVILFCFGTRFLLSAVERLQCERKREENMQPAHRWFSGRMLASSARARIDSRPMQFYFVST